MSTFAPNYRRYKHFNLNAYERKGLSYFLYRAPGDRIVLPLLREMQHKRVLEVGIGAGHYTRYLLNNHCHVTGVDINPHMGAHLGVNIIRATADDFTRYLAGEKFDLVASFWMTEYLAPQEFAQFLAESLRVVRSPGQFLTTFIDDAGWGRFYRWASSVRRIEKFTYAVEAVKAMLPDYMVAMIAIPGRFGLPFAHLLRVTQ